MKMYIFYPCPFSNCFRSCSVQVNNSALLQIILLRMQATFPPILWSCQSLRLVSKNCGFHFALDGKAEWERSHGQFKISDRLQGNRHEVRTFIMNLHSLSFSFQSTVLTLEWHHWVFLTSQLHQTALSLKPRSARIQACHLRGKCDAWSWDMIRQLLLSNFFTGPDHNSKDCTGTVD
jgi:hypothetical protein